MKFLEDLPFFVKTFLAIACCVDLLFDLWDPLVFFYLSGYRLQSQRDFPRVFELMKTSCWSSLQFSGFHHDLRSQFLLICGQVWRFIKCNMLFLCTHLARWFMPEKKLEGLKPTKQNLTVGIHYGLQIITIDFSVLAIAFVSQGRSQLVRSAIFLSLGVQSELLYVNSWECLNSWKQVAEAPFYFQNSVHDLQSDLLISGTFNCLIKTPRLIKPPPSLSQNFWFEKPGLIKPPLFKVDLKIFLGPLLVGIFKHVWDFKQIFFRASREHLMSWWSHEEPISNVHVHNTHEGHTKHIFK